MYPFNITDCRLLGDKVNIQNQLRNHTIFMLLCIYLDMQYLCYCIYIIYMLCIYIIYIYNFNGRKHCLGQLSSLVRLTAHGPKDPSFNSRLRAYVWVTGSIPGPSQSCVGGNQLMCLSHINVFLSPPTPSHSI
uniref:Uncharacterized protein n=1 Tax=Molossus molossus TaxID=27622 RepID=A0A7J8DTE0_MOLMO|nr:hypothetical protein HJG59_009111 [Molossus molossus]